MVFILLASHLLTKVFFPSLLSSEAFSENQSVSGGRKCSAENDSDRESLSLGSDDTPGRDMSVKKVASASKATASKPTPTSSKRKSDDDDDVEMLANRMNLMTLDDDVNLRGYNFNCIHPYFYWTYPLNVYKFIKFEFLVWTPYKADCFPKISTDGLYLYMATRIPNRFVGLSRLFGYYGAANIQGDFNDTSDMMVQKGKETTNMIRDTRFGHDDIKPTTKIKLPFKVLQEFEDPYRPGADPAFKGYDLRSYPHEHVDRHVYIFHVSLKSADVPRTKTAAAFEAVDLDGAGDY